MEDYRETKKRELLIWGGRGTLEERSGPDSSNKCGLEKEKMEKKSR